MTPKQILLIGHNGQLGWELRRSLAPLGNIVAVDFPEINLADIEQLRTQLRVYHPALIINAAAYTAVDQAENEIERAMTINKTAPAVLAEFASQNKAALIHYSTDYVFDGTKKTAYLETDTPDPINAYGVTKLLGEQAIQEVNDSYLIFRTSWLYSLRRSSFVTKVLQWGRSQTVLRVVDDQIGSPTWARMLADTTALIIAMGMQDWYGWIKNRQGVYHLAGTGSATRFDFARLILDLDPKKQEQIVHQILPAKTAEFATPAQRPANSALDCKLFSNTFGVALPDWQSTLELALS